MNTEAFEAGMDNLAGVNRDFIYKDWCAVQVHLVKGAKQTFYAKLSQFVLPE